MICTFTAANCTVGLPPTPEATYVGASTAVVPPPHDGAAPVPPDTTGWPAVVGTHSQPGVTAAEAPPPDPRPTAIPHAHRPIRHSTPPPDTKIQGCLHCT